MYNYVFSNSTFFTRIKVNNRIYVAGQPPINAETGEMPKTIESVQGK